jgi:cell division protease FtsH
VSLYSPQVDLPDDLVRVVVKKTKRGRASFIKERMRRATQLYLERDGSGPPQRADVEEALEEILFRGGSLNRLLLGAGEAVVSGIIYGERRTEVYERSCRPTTDERGGVY